MYHGGIGLTEERGESIDIFADGLMLICDIR